MDDSYLILDKNIKEIDWKNDKCDKYDYIIAASCGALAGLVDIFFVGSAVKNISELSIVGKMSDNATDEIIKKIAKSLGWNPRVGNEGNISSAIGFLEGKFHIPYDHTSTKSVGNNFKINAKDHHFKSLSHSPDPIGLFFSILDQFTDSASFISNRKIIRINADDRGFKLQGSNFVSKLYCGFCNWIGHLLSDVAGSSGIRQIGSDKRGKGLPIPFMQMFLLCDFGSFSIEKDKQSLAMLMTRVFENGYDLRHAGAMAIPVLFEELMIRVLWALKRKFYHKRDWKDCIPTNKHGDLRVMLIVGNGTLCLFDGLGAAICSKGNALSFILHMNIVAWFRLIILVFKELRIRYGLNIDIAVKSFLANIGLNDKYALQNYYDNMNLLDRQLEDCLRDFIVQVEKEYKTFINGMNNSLNPMIGTTADRKIASIEFAKIQKIDSNRIFETTEELKYWLGEV